MLYQTNAIKRPVTNTVQGILNDNWSSCVACSMTYSVAIIPMNITK